MKNSILLAILGLFIISCTSEKKGSMHVSGTIKGLKKGTVYLQKIKDALLVNVDSVKLNGKSDFTLVDNVNSPEIYYVTLKEMPSKKIQFFGEKGAISITTKLNKYVSAANIKGLKNQQLLDKYNQMALKFNDKRLDLVKSNFDAQKSKDSQKITSINKQMRSLIKRRYYYTTNFAVKNANYEVAPYLALTELYDANVKLLDTINSSLSKKVKLSKYGKKLNKFIKDIKASETKN